jgi:hypothetical protein
MGSEKGGVNRKVGGTAAVRLNIDSAKGGSKGSRDVSMHTIWPLCREHDRRRQQLTPTSPDPGHRPAALDCGKCPQSDQ